MKRVFITGITGFAGSYLSEQLLNSSQYEIAGSYLSEDGLRKLGTIQEKVSLHRINLLESKSVKNLLLELNPDIIFHLAAFTSPAESFKEPYKVMENNINGQLAILESVRDMESNPRLMIVSSAEVYGMVVPSDIPVDELTPLRPTSPYSVSKIAQDYLALQYYLSYKMDIVRIRPFNHIGPKQSPDFVVSSFAKKVAEIEKGSRESVLTVGNLEAKRDFSDVRDMVRAYELLIEKGESGDVYNVGSGVSHRISEIVDILTSYSNKDIRVEQDPSLLRPSDIPEIICDNSKIRTLTGWETTISFEQSVKDTLDYWRNIV